MMSDRKNKNILMVRQTGLSGTQNVLSLCNVLCDEGFGVSLVVLDGSRKPSRLNPDVRMLSFESKSQPGSISGRLKAAQFLRKCLYSEEYDLVYLVDSWTVPAFLLATLGRMKVKGKPLVYHTFDWLEPGRVSMLHVLIEKMISRKADLVVNADRSRARMQRTIYGLEETPLWLQNALSVKEEMPSVDAGVIEKMLGRSKREGEHIIIYPTVIAGSGVQDRQAYELIEAVSLLPENFTVVLFAREGDEYSKCSMLAGKLGVLSRVKFLEPVPFEDLMGYVRNSDFGVIFYSDEQSSGYFMCNADKLSLFTACGIPYIASDFPNLESVTYQHDLGICCDSKDPQQISRAINELAASSKDIAAQRKQIRAVFAEYLCLERHIDSLSTRLEAL